MRFQNVFLCLAMSLVTGTVSAQDGRFKLGGGAHVVTNNYDQEFLSAFGAFSFNTSYTLLQQPRFSVAWEQQILLRHREEEEESVRKTAFIVSAPLTFRYQARKTGFYAGMGPGYLIQQYRDYRTRQRISGVHVQGVVGLVVRKADISQVLFPEYHFRAGVYKSLDGTTRLAPHLSFVVLLGANQRAVKTERANQGI